MILVCGASEEVADWVRRRVPWCDGFGGAHAIGVVRNGALIAGVVYANYRKSTIEATIASDDPSWCRKGVIAGLLSYPFLQLGVRRITCVIPEHNERSLRLCAGLGFAREGRHPGAFPDGSAAISFGMLRENCRWLRNAAPSDAAPNISDRGAANVELLAECRV